MAEQIARHLRIGPRYHRLFQYLKRFPNEAVLEEMYFLLNLGLITLEQGGERPHLQPSVPAAAPLSAAPEPEPIQETPGPMGALDISDDLFDSISDK